MGLSAVVLVGAVREAAVIAVAVHANGIAGCVSARLLLENLTLLLAEAPRPTRRG
jgi:hypothetical protein